MTIQTTNKHACFPGSCRHHPAEREDYSSPADHALPFWSNISLPSLLLLCQRQRACVSLCASTSVFTCVRFCRSLSLSTSKFLSASLSHGCNISCGCGCGCVSSYSSSLVLVVSLENGCTDSRNVEIDKYVLQSRCHLLIHFEQVRVICLGVSTPLNGYWQS